MPRALVLEAPEVLRLDDRPGPAPGPGEVLVDVVTTGICGTDISIFTGKIPVGYPLVMGHEVFGRVAAVGAGVKEVSEGARVVIDPVISCGKCFYCSKGQENLCPQGALLGRDRDGGFRDLVAVPAANIYVVPDEIDDAAGPLIQVLTTCMHAQRATPIHPGDSTLVIGLGVTGLMHVQLARVRGARPLIGITRSAAKRALAERLGCELALDPSDPDLHHKVLEATSGRGPDVVIESAGQIETLAKAIELVRVGGHVTLFGTFTATTGDLPFYQLYYKELTITNPRAAKREDFPASIELAASNAIQLEPIVSHRLALERAREAIEIIQRGEALKVVLDHRGDAP